MANDQREQTIATQNHQADMEKLQLEMTMMRERHAFEMQKLASERMAHAAQLVYPCRRWKRRPRKATKTM